MNITKGHHWIKKEGKALSGEELALLCSGIQMYEQAEHMADPYAKHTLLGFAMCQLTVFRAGIFSKLTVITGYMSPEEKKNNYMLAGRATYFLMKCHNGCHGGDGRDVALRQLYDMLPDFEKVTEITESRVQAYEFPAYC